MKDKPKKIRFVFTWGKARMKKPKTNGRKLAAMMTMASDERVLENTPCLKALYEFLARPLPAVTLPPRR